MVLVSKAEKRAIFTFLLKEGVIVVRKDPYLPKHQNVDVPNLKVMMIVKSLVSQGYLNQVFNWQWNYYTVTVKGVGFLAKALGKCERPFSHSAFPSTPITVKLNLTICCVFQVCPVTSCPQLRSRRDLPSPLPRTSTLVPRRLPPLEAMMPPPLLRRPQAWAEATDEVKKVQASATDSCRELLTRGRHRAGCKASASKSECALRLS